MSVQSLVLLSACPTDRLAIGVFLAGMGTGGGAKGRQQMPGCADKAQAGWRR
jgi:hypothetical protein